MSREGEVEGGGGEVVMRKEVGGERGEGEKGGEKG